MPIQTDTLNDGLKSALAHFSSANAKLINP